MIAALERALLDSAAEPAVRVIVLSAVGSVFSSGHDLRQLRRLIGDEPPAAESAAEASVERCLPVFEACSRMMAGIVRLPKPVIASVQGLATAAGCQLVASCDLVVAAESATFATPGVSLALFCSTPAVAVARSIGRKAAMEMLLTGDRVPADRARELGLVNRVVADEDLEQETLALAQQIASRSQLALRLGKEAFYRQLELDLESAYALTSRTMALNLSSADASEGIDAFFDKREPRWSS